MSQPETPKNDPDFNKQLSPQDKVNMQALNAIQSMSSNWLVTQELICFQAKMIRAKYEFLIAEGFEEEQALLIAVKSWN